MSYDFKWGTPGEHQSNCFSAITTSGPNSELSSVNPYQIVQGEYTAVVFKTCNIFLHAGAKENEMKEFF